MPSRPRAHILEDESKQHFRNLLPSHWVFREKSADYGIDGEVEIWREDGQPTSLIFNIQLKATDSTEYSEQRKIRVRRSSFEYWLKQSIPTLIVRYCNNDKSPIVFITWNYDQRIRIVQSGKSCVMNFEESDRWTENTPDKIWEHLQRDRALQSLALSLPIVIHFKDRRLYPDKDQILRTSLQPFRDIVQYRNPSPTDAAIDLYFKEGIWEICVDYRNQLKFELPQEEELSSLGADIGMAAGLCLSFIGQKNVLSKIVSHTKASTRLILDPDICKHLARTLIQTGAIGQLRELTLTCLNREADENAIWALLMAPVDHVDKLEEVELSAHIQFLDEFIHHTKKIRPNLEGTALYIKGTYLTSLHKPKKALTAFIAAIRKNDMIIHFPFLWAQAGGLFFGQKRYQAAAACYIISARMHHDKVWETYANLADTQWRRGRLGSSRFWLGKALNYNDSKSDARHPWYRLLLTGVEFIISQLGSRKLHLDSNGAEQEIINSQDSGTTLTHNDLLRLIKKKIDCIWLWSRLADYFAADNNQTSEIKCRIVAVLCNYTSPREWACLLIDALQFETINDELKTLIIEASLAIAPHNIAHEVHQIASEQTDINSKNALTDIACLFETQPKPKLSRTIRPLRS